MLSLVIAIVMAGCASGQNRKCDEEALREAIVRSAAAFNAGDADAIIAPYARDVVLSYPGIPDMTYEMLKQSYIEMVDRPSGVTVSTVPTIEEVLVSGDLGIIRVMWTTTTTVADPPRVETRKLKDLQVWRREPNGTWTFARGMHYRMTP
jgi:ketosteroid isomerase-like protein